MPAELPADPALDGLRETSQNFAKAVRKSTYAADEMAAAESELEEFAGSLAIRRRRGCRYAGKIHLQMPGHGRSGRSVPEISAEVVGRTWRHSPRITGSGRPGPSPARHGLRRRLSARRSSLRNVGLYGHIPLRGKESRAGGKHADHGASSTSNGESVPGIHLAPATQPHTERQRPIRRGGPGTI